MNILDYIFAGFPVLQVVTHDGRADARRIIRMLKDADAVRPAIWWDVNDGTQYMNTEANEIACKTGVDDVGEAVRSLASHGTENPIILFVSMPDHAFDDILSCEALLSSLDLLRSKQRTVVLIGPVDKLSPAIERTAVRVDLPAIEANEIEEQTLKLLDDNKVEGVEGTDIDAAVESCRGLSLTESSNAVALSLATKGKLESSVIFEAKSKYVASSDAVQIGHYDVTFDDIGGLDALKEFTSLSLRRRASVKPKGVLLLGVPGVGKSMFARALGKHNGVPTVTFDPSAVFGSLVGQSEERVRSALKTIDSLGRSVVFIDEIEKALSGSGGKGDSGTSSRVFGTFLQWLNDRENSDAYVVATCNNISALPPEFSRAERWDCLFFLDIPTDAEREKIWEIYFKKYGLNISGRPNFGSHWTGAEVSTACRLAKMLDIPLNKAKDYVIPLATTMQESIAAMRGWASGRCIDATAGGQYDARNRDRTIPNRSQQIRTPKGDKA